MFTVFILIPWFFVGVYRFCKAMTNSHVLARILNLKERFHCRNITTSKSVYEYLLDGAGKYYSSNYYQLLTTQFVCIFSIWNQFEQSRSLFINIWLRYTWYTQLNEWIIMLEHVRSKTRSIQLWMVRLKNAKCSIKPTQLKVAPKLNDASDFTFKFDSVVKR